MNAASCIEAARSAAVYVHHLPIGVRASLKRILRDTSDRPIVPWEGAYYTIMDRIGSNGGGRIDGLTKEQIETGWALLIGLMAYAPDSGSADSRLGFDLYHVDYHETRLSKFLRADQGSRDLTREVRDIVTRLKQKGRRINWGDFAVIMLSDDKTVVTRKKREIARDYFRIAVRG